MAVQTRRAKGEGGRVVAAYVPLDMADALEARAREEQRSISQVITRTLRTGLRAEVR